jgi:hypothetical protein
MEARAGFAALYPPGSLLSFRASGNPNSSFLFSEIPGSGSVREGSLSSFEVTDPPFCCHSERACEESFFSLRFVQNTN